MTVSFNRATLPQGSFEPTADLGLLCRILRIARTADIARRGAGQVRLCSERCAAATQLRQFCRTFAVQSDCRACDGSADKFTVQSMAAINVNIAVSCTDGTDV